MFASKDTLLTRPSGYNIARSVRLRRSATGNFSRTPASASNRQTWTWSGWVKRGDLTNENVIFGSRPSAGTYTQFSFRNSGSSAPFCLLVEDNVTGNMLVTTQVFRDPSAWYHIILAMDTTQATSSNRAKLYVNGVQVTSFSTANYPAQNANLQINNTAIHNLGRDNFDSAQNFDGYMTEINFVDGQQLTPSSFGETDSITGVWKPKKYGGTYGTNGFYLNFSDNSNNTAATIGKDYSGNGNNWTPNNISVTSGATYDSMVDSPTVGATSSNYATLNPLAIDASSPPTITNGNLAISSTGALATIPMPTGKWYWEATCTSTDADQAVGAYSTSESGKTSISGASNPTYGFIYQANGNARQNGTVVQTWSTFTNNDILSFTYDASIYQLKAYKNNSLVGTITLTTPLSGDSYVPMACCLGGSFVFNFGQRPFSYTPPTGFVALNTYNLPASTIKNGAAYMAATTYTGNADFNNITNSGGFQPDFVWVKERSEVRDHILVDSVRGVSKALYSNLTNAEGSTSNFTEFLSNGFRVGYSGSDADKSNKLNQTYVGWQWKAGTTSASNTNGSITSTVSVGATQGFSVVTYTHNGTNAATVGHGLGVTPSFIINKQRSAASNWRCYHVSLPAGYNIQLNLTQAQSVAGDIFQTAPTSSVFTPGNGDSASGQTMVAYCFAAVAGYSAFGSYTGNGSADGPFIYTGFRPRLMMWKRTDATADWYMWDTTRDTYNGGGQVLWPNYNLAETNYGTGSSGLWDILSNGFKLRTNSGGMNTNGATMIYMAFAENPMKYALAR